jgi:hypothetical protein
MKGTFFSADFVTDKNDDLRLIEINTDTGIVESQAYTFDWTDFISVLQANSITEIDVVYKYDIQHPIVKSLADSIAANAPFIASFNEIIVPAESIFPTSPSDAPNKFILRMAYDESAILDSEYAKGTLSLLKLFADTGDSGSITNFYHSSSYYGYYNTLDTDQFNGAALPDIVSKTVVEQHTPHKFWKIGNSDSGSLERYESFISAVVTPDDILQQYHINQTQLDAGMASSIRSFQIVYGSDLDICYVSQYEIDSVLGLPTTITYDDTLINNLIESKHYYEFATNHIKNKNHGLLENETILDANDNPVAVADLVVGNEYKSFYIEGAPNTDDYEVLRQWTYPGDSLPSGSHATSSILVGKYEDTTYANDITEVKFDNEASIMIGGEARVLVHDIPGNVLRYVRVTDLNTTDYEVFGPDGTKLGITDLNLVIYDEQQPMYQMNMEEVDNFVLEAGNLMTFFVVHNLIGGGCFTAGTKVTMGDGSVKNIEDVVVDDEVISFNETTQQNEVKKVVGLKQPVHNDIVKYSFANQTEITCTLDHPFYVEGLKLASHNPELTQEIYKLDREVAQIKEGDLVYMSNGVSRTAIKSIELQPVEETQTYIITVEDNHNFYANGILVHNK